MYRVLLIGVTCFLLTTGNLLAQTVTRTAAATWQVQKYDIDVTLPQDAGRVVDLRTVLTIKNVSGKPASTLTLRISSLAAISSVKINEATADFTKNEEKINSALSLQRIGIRMASAAPDAIVTATVDYKITLKENTALSAISPVGGQFLPQSFWYPTPNSWFFARGADTAPVQLKVNSAGGLTVVSSGTETAGRFDQRLYVQPFFVAGSWETSNQPGVTVLIPKGLGPDALKRAAELASLMTEAKAFMTGVLGKAPDVPLRIVAARRGSGFGTGGTLIVDEGIFRRSKIDSLAAMNVSESVAKLWLGNAVSVTGDGYGIIGEGLARFLATQFLESKYGKDVADIERLRQRIAYAAVSKRDAPLTTVLPLDDYYYPEVANKGAMAWRILSKRVGATEFASTIRKNMEDGNLNVEELRAAFSAEKELLDYLFEQVTDANLLVGLPQSAGAETRVALRNSGSTDVTVDVAATTVNGEKIVASSTIKAQSFSDISFKSANKILRVEIDTDKLYPQTEYSDDIAPRESTDSDPLLAAKRLFDKQDFAGAEAIARKLLRDLPRSDDLRVLLARALLAQNKNTDAEKEFRAVLDEKLPTSRSISWANVGLAEAASRANQKDTAIKYAETAIIADGEYGASLAARNLRNKLGGSTASDPAVKSFFGDFDKAASSNRKADVDALVVPGEVTKFAGGVSGSTEQWQTVIKQIDRLDANTILIEADMTVKLLNKNQETGMAVYRLIKMGSGWKLGAVDMFEVR